MNKAALRLAIARIPDADTTALYFERAAIAAGHEVSIINSPDDVPAPGSCDLFIVVDPWLYGTRDLPRLDCPSALILIDVHFALPVRAQFAKFFDHVFVAQRDYVRCISHGHDSVQWLPLAGDVGVHFVPNLPRDLDLGFVGKIGEPGTDRHLVLSRVLSHYNTNALDRRYTPWEMGELYSRAKIVFNKSIGGDVNMRVFEALASGALLVTDRIGNGLDELFTEGLHYVGYDSVDEAIIQIDHYLSNGDARLRIAHAGQALLRNKHTYDARLERILAVVQSSSDARFAPVRRASPGQVRLWQAQWARLRGTSAWEAAALIAEGLSPVGYPDLAVGLARNALHAVRAFSNRRS